MKKPILWMLALLLLFSAAGCTSRTSAPLAPEKTKQSENTPAPEGMQKAFGREISLACIASSDGLFAKGVQAQAKLTGTPLKMISSIDEAAGADALICCDEEGEIPALDGAKPVFVYTAHETPSSENVHVLRYMKTEETQAALEAMYLYPSHEAPIRILGLFDSGEEEAYSEYMKMEAAGKLQSKGAYIASDGQAAEDWLYESLASITVGILDTVYAQTPELAMRGFSALQKADRNDAVEICAAGLTQAQIEAMQEDHFLMGAAVGANEYGAGMLALRAALCVLSGETVEREIKLHPLSVSAEEVFALKKEGITAMEDVLTSSDKDIAALCDTAVIKELAEYYGA